MAALTPQLAVAARALFGSASRVTQRLRSVDEQLRAPIALSRRIGFVQVRGGCGTSTTAAYVANLLAGRRSGMVLAVNAAAGPGSLVRHAGVRETEQQRASHLRMGARSARDARDGLMTTASRLYVLDLWRLRGAPGLPSSTIWSRQVAPIARFYDVVVTDWGSRPAALDLGEVAATGHVVCVVTRADRHAMEESARAVERLVDAEEAPPVVVAVVDVGHTADRSAVVSRRLDVPVLTIPYDPVRRSAEPVGSSDLATRTRLAYAGLAAELITRAQSATPTRAQGATRAQLASTVTGRSG